MTNEEKTAIQQRLAAYCQQKGSQRSAANSLDGVSAATISQILSSNWELISDDMWRTVAAQTDYDPHQWNIAETQAYQRMTFLLQSAQQDALTLAVTGAAGSGKTEAIRNFSRLSPHVYHLCCSEYWNRRNFLEKLLRCMGRDITSTTVSDMMDDAIATLKRRRSPLIVLDEADKLSDSVLYFFITLYNNLEGHCGMILCATDFLNKRLTRSLRQRKKGFEETHASGGGACHCRPSTARMWQPSAGLTTSMTAAQLTTSSTSQTATCAPSSASYGQHSGSSASTIHHNNNNPR